MGKLLGGHDKVLLWGNLIVLGTLCFFAIFFTSQFEVFWLNLQAVTTVNFGWLYILTVTAALCFCLYFAFSKYGPKRLGKENEKPEYANLTWVSMLLSAGVAEGVFFYSVAEPLYHYMQTPYLAMSETPEAMSQSLAIIFLHWGIQGWALYALVGLGIGFAHYRLKQPLTFVSSLYGLLGYRTRGPIGRVVDFFCVFTSVSGIAASVGMAVLSLSFVVTRVLNIEPSTTVNMLLLALIIAIYAVSTTAGIDKGMAKISNLNIYLAAAICGFIFLFGPKVLTMNLLMDGVMKYIQYMPYMTMWSDSGNSTGGWLGWWTVFYWAWWLSWTPFVAGFLARISRGRTIKEFILGAFFLPTVMLIIWFTVTSAAAFDIHLNSAIPLWEGVKTATESGFYIMLEAYPMVTLVSIVSLICLTGLIVTSADAGSLFVGMVLSKGNPDPTVFMKLISATLIATVAISLIIGGGLKALQTMVIVASFPFAITTILTIFSVSRMAKLEESNQLDLLNEKNKQQSKQAI